MSEILNDSKKTTNYEAMDVAGEDSDTKHNSDRCRPNDSNEDIDMEEPNPTEARASTASRVSFSPETITTPKPQKRSGRGGNLGQSNAQADSGTIHVLPQ